MAAPRLTRRAGRRRARARRAAGAAAAGSTLWAASATCRICRNSRTARGPDAARQPHHGDQEGQARWRSAGPCRSSRASGQASCQATTRTSQQDGRTRATPSARRERSAAAQAEVHPRCTDHADGPPKASARSSAPDRKGRNRTGLHGRIDSVDRPRPNAKTDRTSTQTSETATARSWTARGAHRESRCAPPCVVPLGYAPRSTAPVSLGREGHRRVAGGRGLLDGQRAVGRAEPQRVRQRLLALADLLAAVDVEQPDGLQEFTRALAQRPLHLGGRDTGVDDQRHVLGGHREGGDPRRLERPRRPAPARRGRSPSRRCARAVRAP